jgi:hypothetical protein
MVICKYHILISTNISTNFNVFDVHVTVHRDKFLTIKPTRCTNFTNLFWNETVHVSDSCSVHHQEFSTVYMAVGICHTDLLSACHALISQFYYWNETLPVSDSCCVHHQEFSTVYMAVGICHTESCQIICKIYNFNISAFVGFIVWIVYPCTDMSNFSFDEVLSSVRPHNLSTSFMTTMHYKVNYLVTSPVSSLPIAFCTETDNEL